MSTKDVKLGGRGEELLKLVYRFGGLTVGQYYLLADERDEVSKENGSKTAGNPYGRRLSSNEKLIRRWVEEGEGDEEVAIRMGVDARSVERFVAKRGLRKARVA